MSGAGWGPGEQGRCVHGHRDVSPGLPPAQPGMRSEIPGVAGETRIRVAPPPCNRAVGRASQSERLGEGNRCPSRWLSLLSGEDDSQEGARRPRRGHRVSAPGDSKELREGVANPTALRSQAGDRRQVCHNQGARATSKGSVCQCQSELGQSRATSDEPFSFHASVSPH